MLDRSEQKGRKHGKHARRYLHSEQGQQSVAHKMQGGRRYSHPDRSGRARTTCRRILTPEGAVLYWEDHRGSYQQASVRKRSGNHGICDLGRSSCGHCDHSHNCLQAQIRRIVERDLDRDQQPLGESGQATAEFAIVFALMLSIIVALGALMNVLGEGVLVEHAVSSASHNAEVLISGACDALMY